MERDIIYEITEWVGYIGFSMVMLAYCYIMYKLDEDPKDRQSSKKLKVKRS